MPPVTPDSEIDAYQREAGNETVAKMFAQAKDYTNVIVAAGYAGGFGVWSFVHDKMPSWLTALAALGLLLSIAAFVLFEVYQMVWRVRTLTLYRTAIVAAADPRARAAALHAYQARMNEVVATKIMPKWGLVLGFTIASALVGLACLVGALVWDLLQLR